MILGERIQSVAAVFTILAALGKVAAENYFFNNFLTSAATVSPLNPNFSSSTL